MEKRLCIGGEANGEFCPVYGDPNYMRIPIRKPFSPISAYREIPSSASFEVSEYRCERWRTSEDEIFELWVERSLSPSDVMKMLIQGYAENHDRQQSMRDTVYERLVNRDG